MQQGVSIGRRFGDNVDADNALGAAAIVEHQRLTQLCAGFIADAARDDVGGAAGGEGDDQADGAGGVGLGG